MATGAVLPSSPELSRMMVDWLKFDVLDTVVEFGPGTGVFTTEIVKRLRPEAKYLGLEINPLFADHLRQEFPNLDIYGRSATEVGDCLCSAGCGKADAIISGLPWAAFPDQLQDDILNAVASVLPEGGSFATFAYIHGLMLPAARRFRQKLHKMFRVVETSPVAWRNVPPAFVYRCVR